ncbi:hypothetical protein BOX15_Mlig002561g1, partial [Macrostomum lignano]
SASNCSPKPRQLLLISGKRKSGKDHVTSRILAAAAERNFPAACVRVSQPLKAEYARLHKLDADRLADSTEYKEAFRADMIAWGERLRAADPGCFCRLAVQMAQPPADGSGGVRCTQAYRYPILSVRLPRPGSPAPPAGL